MNKQLQIHHYNDWILPHIPHLPPYYLYLFLKDLFSEPTHKIINIEFIYKTFLTSIFCKFDKKQTFFINNDFSSNHNTIIFDKYTQNKTHSIYNFVTKIYNTLTPNTILYFVLSNGEKWIFGYIKTNQYNKKVIQTSKEISLRPISHKYGTDLIYKWLVFLITLTLNKQNDKLK
jgi:hypothetical protein